MSIQAGRGVVRFVTLATVLCASLFASTRQCVAQTGEKYALLVGVREYDKNELRSLPFSEADVEGLARLLRDSGYRPENVVVMTQSIGAKKPRFAPVAANIRKELELLLEGRAEGDSIVIALAGHGVQFREDEDSYFCPTDSKLADKSTLIPMGSIFKSLEGSKANLKLLLVDACRNDPQADNSRARNTVKLESVTRPQKQTLPGGVAALFSCSAGERAFEHAELKHGVFFHFIIQGLGGEADFDHDKVVTLPELQQYAMKRVPDFVRAEYGVTQTPDLRGKTRGLFPLLKLDQPSASQTSTTKLRVMGQSIASRQIVQKHIEILENRHYFEKKIDDEVASRWLDILLEDFDAQRKYLLQSDVERLRAQVRDLDDKARLGDVGIAWELFNLWVERRVERRKWVDEWLEVEHDFTVAEELQVRPPYSWSKSSAEAREHWRKQVKQAILYHRAKGYDMAEATHQASRSMQRQFFGTLRSLDDEGILEIALTALGNAYDTHTNYISARGVANFLFSNRQRMVGIGAQLRQEEGGVTVFKVIPGGPAARDGRLKRNDRIVAVGEGAAPTRSVLDLKLSDTVDLIRGKSGTTVRLEVIPSGKQQPVVYDLLRGTVDVETARSMVFTEQRRSDNREVKIGYIALSSLYANLTLGTDKGDVVDARTSSGDLAKILAGFNSQNVEVAVLDLRYNSGGPLSETYNILGLFLDTSPCLIARSRGGKQDIRWSVRNRLVWDRPLVVITSRGTGPGPEIIAGALQDYGRALVIGDSRTSGNGTIQSLVDIGEELVSGNNPPRMGATKYTGNLFFLPSGRTNADIGIIPDLVLPSLYEIEYVDDQREVAKSEPVTPLVFPHSQYVNQKLIEKIKRLSTQRQGVSPDFLDYREQVRKYDQQKRRATIPLDEQRYLAMSRDLITPDYGDRLDEAVVARDTYINEVLAIALDFAPAGKWTEQFTAGMASLRQKAYADAVAKFSAALEQDPDQPAARFQRARAYAGQQQWEKALADASSVGPGAVSAFVTVAVELKVGNNVGTKLKAGHRVVVQRVNGEWVWVQPVEKPKAEGWVKKTDVSPIIPEAASKKN